MTEPVTVECQKSPILSQPKTIRFPAKQQDDSKKEPRKHTTDSLHCRWDNCHAHFDTSGALLEHLQVGDDNLYGQKIKQQQREGYGGRLERDDAVVLCVFVRGLVSFSGSVEFFLSY